MQAIWICQTKRFVLHAQVAHHVLWIIWMLFAKRKECHLPDINFQTCSANGFFSALPLPLFDISSNVIQISNIFFGSYRILRCLPSFFLSSLHSKCFIFFLLHFNLESQALCKQNLVSISSNWIEQPLNACCALFFFCIALFQIFHFNLPVLTNASSKEHRLFNRKRRRRIEKMSTNTQKVKVQNHDFQFYLFFVHIMRSVSVPSMWCDHLVNA